MFFERGMKVSRRRVILFLADLICLVASLIAASLIRLGSDAGWGYVQHHLPSLTASCVIFLLVFYAGGLYERQTLMRRETTLGLSLVLVLVGLVIIVLLFYARLNVQIGRGILMLATVFIFLSTLLVRHLYRVAAGYGLLSKNTLIVGEGPQAASVIKLLGSKGDSEFRVFGIVACTGVSAGEFLEGIPILGNLAKLREFADVYAIETIIVATSLSREHSVLRVLRPLRYSGIEILDYVSLNERLGHEIPLDHIDDEWLMHAAMNSSRIHIRKVKRIMDLSVAVLGLAFCVPIALIAAVLVKLDSAGPVLFLQRRAGLDGRPYTLMKFRTMRHNAEADSGAVWAGRFDSRVTRVGRFLRKWRIDELPQLINVLRGEMSLVGPRPERPEFIDTLVQSIPYYRERLAVPPGITGWAQVNYPYAASIEASRRKLQFDLYYIKNMSSMLDITILLRTFRTIIQGIRYGEDLEESPAPAPASGLRVLPSNPAAKSQGQKQASA